MIRRLIWAGLALLVATGFAWALWPHPIPVETATVEARDIEVAIEEDGQSRIREVFTVSAPISGRMERLALHAGDPVAAGETVVARMSPAAPTLLDARSRRIAEATRDAAEAALGLARAELARAEAQAAFAESELDRSGRLLDRGAIPARAMEQAGLDAAAARAAVDSARANLLVRERELETAQAALIEGTGEGETCCVEVAAPASGRVLRVLTESEQVVGAGTPLVEIGDPADIEVVVDLLSSDAVRVEDGASAVVRDWGGPPIPARVERIDPSAVTEVSALGTEEQRVTAVLALEGEPEAWAGLGDGYRVTAAITVWRGEGRVALPLGALFRDGADWAVFRVVDGRARLIPVAIGERNQDWAEVLQGIAAGDVVVLRPSDRVADGVRVAPEPAPG